MRTRVADSKIKEPNKNIAVVKWCYELAKFLKQKHFTLRLVD